MSVIMRPIESPWVAAGAGLQIFRGLIVALVLFPFRDVFLSSKKGWIKLWALILGLSYISTIGPTFGSFEGYIYTNVPLQYHLLGIPETLIYTFLFTILISLWYKKPSKVWNVVSIILVSLIILMSTLGLLSSLSNLEKLRNAQTTPNSGYPATLRSAQIAPYGRNFGYPQNVI